MPEKDKALKALKKRFLKSRLEALIEILLFSFGAGLLVAVVAIAIFVSNRCFSLSPDVHSVNIETVLQLHVLLRHFGAAFLVLLALGLTVFAANMMMPKWLSVQAIRLEWVLDQLAGKKKARSGSEGDRLSEPYTLEETRELFSSDEGLVGALARTANTFQREIVPSFLGSDAEEENGRTMGIVRGMQAIIEKAYLVHDQVVFCNDDPGQTLGSIICHESMVNADLDTVRFVGTMMGVTGEGSYSLTKHTATLAQLKLVQKPRVVFKQCKIVMPGCRAKFDERGSLYPAWGRYFAIEMLENLRNIYGENDGTRNAIPEKGIRILIRFRNGDCFPAWHLWGKQRFVVLCSVGADDRFYTGKDKLGIADALPIAISGTETVRRMYKDVKKKFDMNETMGRLEQHFEVDLFRGDDEGIEQWILSKNLDIHALNIQPNAWGVTKEKELHATLKNGEWKAILVKTEDDLGHKLSAAQRKEIKRGLIEIGEIDDR